MILPRLPLLGLLAIVLLVAGCVQGPATSPSASADAESSNRRVALVPEGEGGVWAWNNTGRALLLKTDMQFLYTFDALCVSGGGPQLERAGGHVLPQTGRLLVHVEVDPRAIYSGLRIGYAVDSNGAPYETSSDKPISWLPAVYDGSRTFTIPVAPEAWENPSTPLRWHFYLTLNPDREDLCFTGFAHGSASVRVEALREEAVA